MLFRRHETLQFLVPMLHNDERGRRGARVGPERFDHREPLPVWRHVVHADTRRDLSQVAPFEEIRRRAGVGRAHR